MKKEEGILQRQWAARAHATAMAAAAMLWRRKCVVHDEIVLFNIAAETNATHIIVLLFCITLGAASIGISSRSSGAVGSSC